MDWGQIDILWAIILIVIILVNLMWAVIIFTGRLSPNGSRTNSMNIDYSDEDDDDGDGQLDPKRLFSYRNNTPP